MQPPLSTVALDLMSQALWVAILVAAPLLVITTLVGLTTSVLQVVTQIQESAVSFLPKLIAAVLVLLLLGGWMMATVAQFATRLISSIPGYF